jgi:hypothetical protein
MQFVAATDQFEQLFQLALGSLGFNLLQQIVVHVGKPEIEGPDGGEGPSIDHAIKYNHSVYSIYFLPHACVAAVFGGEPVS